jgi:hypothetical protein
MDLKKLHEKVPWITKEGNFDPGVIVLAPERSARQAGTLEPIRLHVAAHRVSSHSPGILRVCLVLILISLVFVSPNSPRTPGQE